MATLTVKGIPALIKQIDAGYQPRFNNKTQTFEFTERDKPDARCRVHDGDGLYLVHVPNTNSTSWEYRYRWGDKKKSIRLGSLSTVTLSKAHQKRRKCESQLDDDLDPMEDRKNKQKAKITAQNKHNHTFTGLIWDWSVTYHKREGLADSTKVRNDRILGYLEQDLGSKPIASITRNMVLLSVLRIRGDNGKETAVRAYTLCRSFFDSMMLKHEDLVRGNPVVSGIRKELGKVAYKPRKGLTAEADIAHLLRCIWTYQGNAITVAAMQLMAHTFLRSVELRFAKWSEINFTAKEWIIPVERAKWRTKDLTYDLPHFVPLTPQMIDILQQVHAITGDDPEGRLFPSCRSGRVLSENTINGALSSMGFKDRHTQHGFRKTAATRLAALHTDAVTVKRQSGRLDGGIEGVYNLYDRKAERTKMMRQWSAYLDDLRNGAKVIAIKSQGVG